MPHHILSHLSLLCALLYSTTLIPGAHASSALTGAEQLPAQEDSILITTSDGHQLCEIIGEKEIHIPANYLAIIAVSRNDLMQACLPDERSPMRDQWRQRLRYLEEQRRERLRYLEEQNSIARILAALPTSMQEMPGDHASSDQQPDQELRYTGFNARWQFQPPYIPPQMYPAPGPTAYGWQPPAHYQHYVSYDTPVWVPGMPHVYYPGLCLPPAAQEYCHPPQRPPVSYGMPGMHLPAPQSYLLPYAQGAYGGGAYWGEPQQMNQRD